MKASELIALLQQQIEEGGDLGVVVCGLDGYGYDDIGHSQTVSGVQVNSFSCTYCPVEHASVYGANPGDHVHLILIGQGE